MLPAGTTSYATCKCSSDRRGIREQKTPLEGGKDCAFGMLKVMLTEMPPKDPIDEL